MESSHTHEPLAISASRQSASSAAGAMGRGIAQIAATGRPHRASVRHQPACNRRRARLPRRDFRQTRPRKASSSQADAHAALARVQRRAGDASELAGCDWSSRRSSRNSTSSGHCSANSRRRRAADCVLASNTSSLSITAIAAGCSDPSRVAGLSLLQPRAADEGGRGDRRPAQRPRGRRRADGPRAPHGPHAGAREGHARLHRESRGPRHEYRGLARRGRRRGRASPTSTASCASRRAFASGRSSCST